uniref:Uncharacterized protein n=1 Tax=Ixodes ricinus TaxID=34613 RepID=A0A0K8REQ6_IXORI
MLRRSHHVPPPRRRGILAGFMRASMTMHLCCCAFLCVYFCGASTLILSSPAGFHNKTSDMTRHGQNLDVPFRCYRQRPAN